MDTNLNFTATSATYEDHMGTDLTVVNAARASFNKRSQWRFPSKEAPYEGAILQQQHMQATPRFLSKGDANLLRFLATGYRSTEWSEFLNTVMACKDPVALEKLLFSYKNKAQHWAPFAHPQVQISLAMPIFLARQMVKHQIGGTWSEESRRYLEDNRVYAEAPVWHDRPEDVKQGAGEPLPGDAQQYVTNLYETSTAVSDATYAELRRIGVAPEEARTVLPLNLMTHVTWTGSLLFWARVCNQRLDSHAQNAAQFLARQINDIVQPLFPVSWPLLVPGVEK